MPRPVLNKVKLNKKANMMIKKKKEANKLKHNQEAAMLQRQLSRHKYPRTKKKRRSVTNELPAIPLNNENPTYVYESTPVYNQVSPPVPRRSSLNFTYEVPEKVLRNRRQGNGLTNNLSVLSRNNRVNNTNLNRLAGNFGTLRLSNRRNSEPTTVGKLGNRLDSLPLNRHGPGLATSKLYGTRKQNTRNRERYVNKPKISKKTGLNGARKPNKVRNRLRRNNFRSIRLVEETNV